MKSKFSIAHVLVLVTLALLAGFLVALYPNNVSANVCGDGRINCEPWQTGAVFCDSSGVRVLYSISGDPREGQIAVSVSASSIPQPDPNGSHIEIARSADNYTLHRLNDGQLQFTAPGLEPGTLYEFRFPYPTCRSGAPPPPPVNNVVQPTSVPLPTNTPTVPETVTVDCNTPGQYQIRITSGYSTTSVSYNLATTPNNVPLAGVLTGVNNSVSANYGAVGTYDITGTYQLNSGTPQVVNITGCQGT